MAGETVVSFSIGGLRGLLVAEGEYLDDLRSPVDELREKLTIMEGWLEYAEARRDKRTKEVVELADKLIDSIESYVVLRVSSKNIIACFRLRERRIRQKVRSDIEVITTKITDLVKGLSETIKVGGDSASSTLGKAYKVQDLSNLNEDDFVGRKDDIQELVNYLINDDQIRIISILGMGGLGKTTLARKVYKDKRVVSHFEGFAFVCVSQQCQAEAISRHILQQLAPENKEEEIKSMSETEVIKQLQIVYRKKSCLVVIDDLWSVDDWKSLSGGLTDGDMAGKVIITTRKEEVAKVGKCYKPDCLTEEEGWELFQKKICLPRRQFTEEVNQKMEELGRKMIGRCRGIPLAVLLLRGVLVTKATLREWERFYKRRTREVEHKQLYGEVIEELLFSYNELPYQLRPCFLYLGYFLEDTVIEAETLYMLWNAEGMLLSKDRKEGETMMDVAERYLGELVRRSMVEAKFDTSRRLKSCRLHDLMRELCLSIEPEVAQNVRSLRFIRGNLEKFSGLNKFKFLRVLDFSEVYVTKKSLLKETIHLKYLCSIDGDISRKLPLGNFQYLQSLDLCTYYNLQIPNVLLRKMRRLRHLFLPERFKVTPKLSRLRLEGMIELETLVNFDSRTCEIKDVIQVANLRRFEGEIWISSEDDAEDWKGLIGNMTKVDPRRSSLQMFVHGDHIFGDGPQCEAPIVGLRGKLLEIFNFTPFLSQLHMTNICLKEDPMPTLEKLQNLEVFTIKNVELKGKEMTCSTMGFPQLRFLEILNMKNLEKWRVEEGAMRNLFSLRIDECSKLEMLPDGLKYLAHLRYLDIGHMPEEFIKRVQVGDGGEEGADFYKIRHVRVVSIL